MSTQQRVFLYGGSFDPPGQHHRSIVQELTKYCDKVIVLPCGPNRGDKPGTDDTPLIHRAIMSDLTFGDIPQVEVDLSDLERERFTKTWQLAQKFSQYKDLWIVVGSDLIVPQSNGLSKIQNEWERGRELWNNSQFAILSRPEFALDPLRLPPHCQIIESGFSGSSSALRNLAAKRQSLQGFVTPRVAEHIENYGLYRGAVRTETQLIVDNPRVLLISDPDNPQAVVLAQEFARLYRIDSVNPELIVVIGGDGTMLHAIPEHWQKRIPFFGINAGHRGFLLNEVRESMASALSSSQLVIHHSPLLYAEVSNQFGNSRSGLAFNDVWLERFTGQTAWIEVKIDDRVRIPALKGDALLVATAAGSTAYARAMGAVPFQAGTPVLVLAGSNVTDPRTWKSAHLPLQSKVEMTALDTVKRPVQAFIDGIDYGLAQSLKVRTSNIASCELAFLPDYNLAEKLTNLQFQI